MSKILCENGIVTKKDRYNMSEAPGKNLSEMIGQRLEIKAYLLFEDIDSETGESKKTLKVMTTEGEVCGTRSKSFIEGFEKYLSFVDDEPLTTFAVDQKRSKNNRNYLVFIA